MAFKSARWRRRWRSVRGVVDWGATYRGSANRGVPHQGHIRPTLVTL